ncbi:MAG: hypothetical protein KIS66_16815 [Fimbriimonadaceae bacterium]|nr:hypothetical protein [Fimbriimonadaceae bacterium]
MEKRIGPAALLIGYAMSRLDARSLVILGCRTWDEAFEKAGGLLGERPKSIKALRDEFDPFFDNARRGWSGRAARRPLVALMHEMEGVSDAALESLVQDVIEGRGTAVQAVDEAIATPPDRLAHVADRLRTGAFAERVFQEHCLSLVGLPRSELVDTRNEACGYDFRNQSGSLMYEIKGLTTVSGNLLFTDLEWRIALASRSRYLLVVVSGIPNTTRAAVLADPTRSLAGRPRAERRFCTSWTSPYREAEFATTALRADAG